MQHQNKALWRLWVHFKMLSLLFLERGITALSPHFVCWIRSNPNVAVIKRLNAATVQCVAEQRASMRRSHYVVLLPFSGASCSADIHNLESGFSPVIPSSLQLISPVVLRTVIPNTQVGFINSWMSDIPVNQKSWERMHEHINATWHPGLTWVMIAHTIYVYAACSMLRHLILLENGNAELQILSADLLCWLHSQLILFFTFISTCTHNMLSCALLPPSSSLLTNVQDQSSCFMGI